MTGKKMRILIVDDEKNMRTTLSDILQEEGYEVSTAEDGNKAVEVCKINDFDIILMDVRMPGLDGVEAFKRIRRHREGVRIIMMSAYSVDELKQASLEEGAIAFLSKPLHVEEVLKLIEEVKGTAILVVEDDETVSTPMQNALQKQGYWVRVVSSPHDALELIEQIRFDIIFIDVELPAMNGLDLYLAIKKVTPSAVAIMISGMEKEFEQIAQKAVRQTAYTIVKKPLDLDNILGLLERLSSQRVSNMIEKPNTDKPEPKKEN